MTSPPQSQSSVGDAKAKALVDAFLEEKAKESPANGPRSGAGSGRMVLSVVLGILCVAVWFAPLPAREAPFVLDPVTKAAGARVSVFLAAAKVQAFRAKSGRLPASLEEAKVTDADLAYARVSDSVFVLQTTVEGQQIVHDSRRPPREVLGGSVAIIERRGK